MKFDDFDKQMRVYEQSLDQFLLPETYVVARLDGRSFTKLTKETYKFEAPFDIRFRDIMVSTVQCLMTSGFNVIYGYTQSDEISLLFKPGDNTFGRKVRKYNSVLAGIASASFSTGIVNIGRLGIFDCRVVPLPTVERVKDYFLWRQEDSNRNALNSWCYWTLRKEGYGMHKATSKLKGLNRDEKLKLLSDRDIQYFQLPAWQKFGTGLYWNSFEKTGINPQTGEQHIAKRRKLVTDYNIPTGEKYGNFIKSILEGN